MNNLKIYQITDSFRLCYDDSVIKEGYSISLEEYYCETFFTKEPETIAWINSFQDGTVFFDIGANVGQYSIFASTANPVRSYAFEPYLVNFQRLCENITLNNTSNVIPLFIALSNVNRIEKLYIGDTRFGASGNQVGQSIDERGIHFNPLQVQHIPTFCLDDFVEIFKLPSPNHMKIDVDGIENKIIEGMKHILTLPTIDTSEEQDQRRSLRLGPVEAEDIGLRFRELKKAEICIEDLR